MTEPLLIRLVQTEHKYMLGPGFLSIPALFSNNWSRPAGKLCSMNEKIGELMDDETSVTVFGRNLGFRVVLVRRTNFLGVLVKQFSEMFLIETRI